MLILVLFVTGIGSSLKFLNREGPRMREPHAPGEENLFLRDQKSARQRCSRGKEETFRYVTALCSQMCFRKKSATVFA